MIRKLKSVGGGGSIDIQLGKVVGEEGGVGGVDRYSTQEGCRWGGGRGWGVNQHSTQEGYSWGGRAGVGVD